MVISVSAISGNRALIACNSRSIASGENKLGAAANKDTTDRSAPNSRQLLLKIRDKGVYVTPLRHFLLRQSMGIKIAIGAFANAPGKMYVEA
jgi:hypothetical protein